jgi:hypothetical protein
MTQNYYDVPDDGPRKKRRKFPEIAIGLAFGCVGAAGVGYFFLAKEPESPAWSTAPAPYSASVADAAAGAGASAPSVVVGLRSRQNRSAPVRMVRPYEGVVAPTGSGETAVHCPQIETVYAAIAETTQGAGITEIINALTELEANPGGVEDAGGTLAQRLRARLDLAGASTPCGTIQAGLGEALRMARLAAADADLATAEIVDSAPPTSFSAIPSGGGAEGSGYTY